MLAFARRLNLSPSTQVDGGYRSDRAAIRV